jgi:hypothetical protein
LIVPWPAVMFGQNWLHVLMGVETEPEKPPHDAPSVSVVLVSQVSSAS